MSTFNESLHPRSRSGQFTEKTNDAPHGSLDFEADAPDILVAAGREGALAAMRGDDPPSPEAVFEQLTGRAPETGDAADVNAFAEQFQVGYDLATGPEREIDVDKLLSDYADARAEKIGRVNVNEGDDDAYEEYEDSVMGSVDDMFTALQRYRAKELAEQAADARPAEAIAVAAVRYGAALDAEHLRGEDAVRIATAAVLADRAARAGAPIGEAEPAELDPQPWLSEASGRRYAVKPCDGHGPYRFTPRVGFVARRADYR